MYGLRSRIIRGMRGGAVIGVAVVGLSSQARAATMAYDSFDYGVGGLANQNGGDGWATAWKGNAALTADAGATVMADSLVAPPGYAPAPSGGSAYQIAMLAYRGLASEAQIDLDIDAAYYISFLAQRTTITQSRAYSLLLQSGSTTQVTIGTSTGGAVNVTAGGLTTPADSATIGNGSTSLWTIKILASADGPDQVFVRTYSTPLAQEIPSLEPEAWTLVSHDFASSAVISQIGFAIGSNAALQIDEVRIGTTWASIVPEPASAAMLLLGAMVVGNVRRRVD